MYIIIGKQDNDIKGYGSSIEYLENDYPYIKEMQTAYLPDEVQILTIDSIPENIKIGEWCYTLEEGFYENPKWINMEEIIKLTPEYQAGYDQAVLDMINDGIL